MVCLKSDFGGSAVVGDGDYAQTPVVGGARVGVEGMTQRLRWLIMWALKPLRKSTGVVWLLAQEGDGNIHSWLLGSLSFVWQTACDP